jgi:hypothetical protein
MYIRGDEDVFFRYRYRCFSSRHAILVPHDPGRQQGSTEQLQEQRQRFDFQGDYMTESQSFETSSPTLRPAHQCGGSEASAQSC